MAEESNALPEKFMWQGTRARNANVCISEINDKTPKFVWHAISANIRQFANN